MLAGLLQLAYFHISFIFDLTNKGRLFESFIDRTAMMIFLSICIHF